MKQMYYSEARNQIQGGDLIEFAGRSIVARAIRWKTKAIVNHTAMAIWQEPKVKRGDNRGNLADRLYVIESISNGLRLTHLRTYIETYKGKIYWAPLKTQFDSRRPMLLFNIGELEGTKYGWVDLVTQLRHRTPLDATRLYCSESVHLAAVRSGMLPQDYSPTGMTKDAGTGCWPGDFQRTELWAQYIEIIK